MTAKEAFQNRWDDETIEQDPGEVKERKFELYELGWIDCARSHAADIETVREIRATISVAIRLVETKHLYSAIYELTKALAALDRLDVKNG
jgi:hypothetical protein